MVLNPLLLVVKAMQGTLRHSQNSVLVILLTSSLRQHLRRRRRRRLPCHVDWFTLVGLFQRRLIRGVVS